MTTRTPPLCGAKTSRRKPRMTTEAFAAEIRHHWKKWLPKKWRELEASGRMQAEIMAVARMANDEKMRLMRAGYQEHEADEVVRHEYILLRPEK